MTNKKPDPKAKVKVKVKSESKWQKNKKKTNSNVKEIKVEVTEHVPISKADPEKPVSSIPSMSFQRNQYEKDVFYAAAKHLGLSINAYLRQAGLEKAAKLNIY